MERMELIERLAEWFNLEPDENGNYDLRDYDWQAGCYIGYSGGERFLSLAEIVRCLEGEC